MLPVNETLTSPPVPIELVVNAGPAKFATASPPVPDSVKDVIAPVPSTLLIVISKSLVGVAPPNTFPGILITQPTLYPVSAEPEFLTTGL